MNPWTQVLNRIWYYLEEGPRSAGVTGAFPPANRYRGDGRQPEPDPPENVRQPVLIVDQSGGELDLDYSPHFLRAREQFQITVWTGGLELERINDLRLAVLSALEAGLPDLGLESVLDVKFRVGRVSPALDKVERDADGRLMQWRRDLQRARRYAVLLELTVDFLIDRSAL